MTEQSADTPEDIAQVTGGDAGRIRRTAHYFLNSGANSAVTSSDD